LVVDLGVGLWAWPLPMDFDGDGDIDLVVSCNDKPYHATVLFENPGGGSKTQDHKEGLLPAENDSAGNRSGIGSKMPIFKPAVKLGAHGGIVASPWSTASCA